MRRSTRSTSRNGARLAQTQSAQAKVVVAELKQAGLTSSAREIESANATYTKSIAPLAGLAAGAPRTVIDAAVAAETAAFTRMLAATSSAATQLRGRTARSLQSAVERLDSGRRVFLIADAIAAALAIGGGIALGERARRRESAGRMNAERHEFETTLTDALEMAKFETDAYRTMTDALGESVPRLQVEMLVADSSRAHFHQTLHTGTDEKFAARSGCTVVSPVDCPATRRGRTLVFPTSSALNACPFLKARPSGDLAAACIPISITGQTSGVVHATTPDGSPPTSVEIGYLEITSRRASERIAMLRAFEKSEAQARTDPLTGLWNRRSLENRINDLAREGTPYALAYGDLDNFKTLNDTHGHESGDQALRLFSRCCASRSGPATSPRATAAKSSSSCCPTARSRRQARFSNGSASGWRSPFRPDASHPSRSASASRHRSTPTPSTRSSRSPIAALLTAKVNGRNRTVRATENGASPPRPVEPVQVLAASPDRTA